MLNTIFKPHLVYRNEFANIKYIKKKQTVLKNQYVLFYIKPKRNKIPINFIDLKKYTCVVQTNLCTTAMTSIRFFQACYKE